MVKESAQDTKARLLGIYRDLLARAPILTPSTVRRLGCPFFAFPRNRWFESKSRVLIVGQEPFEWGFNDGLHYDWPYPPLWSLEEVLAYDGSADALTYAYVTHTYEIPSPYRPTPFTRAFDLFMKAANRESTGDVISTNLFKCVYRTEGQPDQRSPLNAPAEERLRILDWQRGCLAGEIRSLQPTSVVFFTGRAYDGVLVDEFPGTTFETIGERDPQQFARVAHNSLPRSSFRTYHPKYLQLSRKWQWVEQLASGLFSD
jgi:hypothetical protein